MIRINRKNSCVFCKAPATLTIKAPFATPVSCCDRHHGRGFVMGSQAVETNDRALRDMADPRLPCRPMRLRGQVGIQAATDEWVEKHKEGTAAAQAHDKMLRELQDLNAQLAEVKRQQAELDRQALDELAIAEAYKLLSPLDRALAIEDMKQRGKAQFQQASAMRRIRDRRRVREEDIK